MIEKIYRDKSEIDFENLWEKGTIVFDANVLLDLYRLPLSARDDLLNILKNEKINKNIWIPFQVKLEFLNNRHNAIGDQKSKFQTVKNIIEKTINQYDDMVNEMKSELKKLKLKERHSLIEPEKYLKNKKLNKGRKNLEKFINNLNKLEKEQIDVHQDDKLKTDILELFKDKTGPCLTEENLQKIYKDGATRYEKEIPPGYKDSGKPGSYFYGEVELIRKYGDLIVWNEIIKKVKKDKTKFLIFITGDVKEDWWYVKRGKRLGPKYELLNEIYTKSPSLETFYMYDTSAFMRYAKEKLELNVKEESIKEFEYLLKEIKKIPKLKLPQTLSNLSDVLNNVIEMFGKLKVSIKGTLKSLPLIDVPEKALYKAFTEIFSNVLHHGIDKKVKILIMETSDNVIITFRNRIDENRINSTPLRSKGLNELWKSLENKYIQTKFNWNEDYFKVELKLPIYTLTNNIYHAIPPSSDRQI